MTPPVAQTQVIMDFILSLGWDAQQELGWPIYPGPLILDEPDQSLWITLSGGPGYVTEEGSADSWTFQAMIRGASDDPLGPDAQAVLLDQLLFGGSFPVVIDGVTIQNVHRVGSPPAPLPVDPNDLRHSFTCTYVITAGV